MRIAFNTSRRNGDTWEDQANFVSVTVWGNHAETCSKYLSKGKRVALQGRLQYREWESDGGTRSTIEIVAERVQFIEPRSDSDSPRPAQARESAPPPVEDDDIPF
jgi:single-strand DNA-binding protein